jgi:murE/murF fusion protein
MQLSGLISEIDALSVTGECRTDKVEISSVEIDAGRVRAGSLFIALPFWPHGDRRNSVSRALERGAAAVVAEHETLLASAPTRILVGDSRLALGRLVGAFHGHPSRGMTVLAVTGTQGKTTVTQLLRHILCATQRRSECIGTLGATVRGEIRETGYTTPPAEILQPLLAEMRSAGATHVCLEASSEGLALQRLSGTTVAVGGLTNVTRDHLDFHADLAAYFEAKSILFRHLAERACFNVDDPIGEQFHRVFRGDRLSVSTAAESAADLVLAARQTSLHGSFVEARYGAESYRFMLPLPGTHNVENAAVALGMSLLAGVSLGDGVGALEEATAPRGRLERVGDRPRVFVDFAHTPSALRRVLTELRALVPERLVCVFGAGGNRDPGKRPLMGQAVSELADVAIVTSDNPRWEDASAIVRDVLSGASGPARILVNTDRRQALARAIAEAGDDDTILVAGKGHEASQEVRGVRLPFDDASICREQLALRPPTPAGLSVDTVEAALETSGAGGRNVSRFTQVVVDLEAVVPGSLFVTFTAAAESEPARRILHAVAKGATGVICEPAFSGAIAADVRSFSVRDIAAAYRTIAGAWRRSFRLPILAVAGAAGKTTTKDLVAATLSPRFDVLATQENLNGFLGVPYTLLQLRAAHEVAIVEIGIDAPGLMTEQAALVDPGLAVLTSLGLEHLDGLRDLAGAVDEETAIFRHVARAGGTLFVNLDDALVVQACERLDGGRRIGFTLADDAAAHAARAAVHQVVRGRRRGDRLVIDGMGLSALAMDQPLPGAHNARNIVAAVAIARCLGAGPEDIVAGLNRCSGSHGRSECVSFGGIHLIGDFYNANPVSMHASLRLLDEMRHATGGRAWACLGEMAQMSAAHEEVHRNVAREAHRLGLEHVITLGEPTRCIVDELRRLGSTANCQLVDSCDEMAHAVLKAVAPPDVVLLKGSRSNQLERVWERLAEALWVRDLRCERQQR